MTEELHANTTLSQLWGEQISDLMSLPREIASKITSNLRLTISGEARNRLTKHYTDNPEAYHRISYHLTRSSCSIVRS